MRNEAEMLDLIVSTAKSDDRIRAVVMSGSRANPNAPKDIFQDFDIVYVVREVDSFLKDPAWINRFGERMILQTPETMQDPPPQNDGSFTYLMQFMDGNRIDLSLCSFEAFEKESASLLLLDKDGLFAPFPPPTDRDYLPAPPNAQAFADCCNEFWWICLNVIKGLARREITYAKHMHDAHMRDQLMKMLAWHVGMTTNFHANLGNHGKYLKRHLEPGLFALLEKSYANADIDNSWNALETTCDLFRLTATHIATHFVFEYPHEDDQRVSDYLRRVRSLSHK